MFDKESIQELAQAQAIEAADTAISGAIGTGPGDGLVALPSDFTVHDLEKHLPNRRRLRGAMVTGLLADFAAYVDANKERGAATFVHQDQMTALAVLNLGTPEEPGHADNTARFTLKQTAAYAAMMKHAKNEAMKQTTVAEFLEDWPGLTQCFNDATEISPPKAIAAVRRITIESLSKVESSQQSLQAERSTFDSVQAKSTDLLPTFIYFKTVPYIGLAERTFVLRLGIHTGGKEPLIGLRLINAEKHAEEMAAEMAALVRAALAASDVPVMVGTYAVTA